MSKILTLRTARDPIRPVLMLLTSHRIDCLLLCLRSLERFTKLERFKRVYVLANAVEPDHAAILHKFMHTHGNVEVIHCSPRGMIPAMNVVQNEILAEHFQDVIVRLEEDVFVTPLWLEQLTEAFRAHQNREDFPLATALSPVSATGRHVLGRHLKNAHPAERAMYEGAPVPENWAFHRWMWEKVIGEDFMEAFAAAEQQPYFYTPMAALHCAMFDARLLRGLLPLPTGEPGEAADTALKLNAVLVAHKWRAVVAARCVAHHYSYHGCEEYLRSHVPLDMVWEYLQELWRRANVRALGGAVRRVRLPAPQVAGGGA